MTTKIDVLHARDSDYDCELVVFVNGIRHDNLNPTDVSVAFFGVDPGAGYDYQDFKASAEEAIGKLNSDEAKVKAESLLDGALDSPYLDNKPVDEESD